MLTTISAAVWRLSLILRPFGVRQPGSLKIGEYDSLCEVGTRFDVPQTGQRLSVED